MTLEQDRSAPLVDEEIHRRRALDIVFGVSNSMCDSTNNVDGTNGEHPLDATGIVFLEDD